MYRIAVCDNKQIQAEELKRQLLDIAADAGFECRVDIFRNFKQMYSEAQTNPYQLICTDVLVGGGNGLDFARKLRFKDGETDIIFVTEYSEYALAAYSVFPVGYVIKPPTKRKLRDAVLRSAAKYCKRATVHRQW